MGSEAASGAAGGAAQGALVGSVVPGVGTIAGAAVGGIAGLIGGMGASAANKAAANQLKIQQQNRAEAMALAAPTADEIATMHEQNAVNERDISRKESLLASADPALIEAGKQALGLLKGENIQSLEPLRQQREQQKEVLKSQLRNQLGEGYETSTAGIQALSRFDQATSQTMFDATNQRLGTLLGVAQNTEQYGNLSPNMQTMSSLLQSQNAIRTRQTNAALGSPITANSGAFVGQAVQAQTMGNIFGGMANAYIGAKLGQSATAPTPTPGGGGSPGNVLS